MADRRDVPIDLVPGQLSAFTRLGALGDLDLHFVGVDQIFGRDAEAAGRDLLDGRAHRIAVGERLEAVALFAAFAGVRLAADPVHGDGEGGVRFAADRTEAHRAGGEALHDLARRFDFVQRNGCARGLELEQTANGQQPPALIVYARREVAILIRQVAAHRVL